MNRGLSLVVCLVFFMGCQNAVDSKGTKTTPTKSDSLVTQEVSQKQADPRQCEEWKSSATFVLVKLSLGAQMLRDDAGYATLAGPDVPEVSKLDPAEIREQLQKLKNLPDPSETSSVSKPSVVVREIEEALDLMEANFAAKTPFANGSGDGQKLVALLETLYLKSAMSFSEWARECGCSF